MKEIKYSLSLGSCLQNGKYVIKSVLGQGGFGITYLAEHTMLDVEVAIKEFFLKGQYIGSLTCNTGDGYVSAYTYKDGNILIESIEYDGWNEKELVKVKTARDKFIADIWENSDSTINLKPMK